MTVRFAVERKRRPRRRALPGTAPGTLLGDADAPAPIIRVIAYGPDALVEETLPGVEDVSAWIGREAVTWINVDGVRNASVVARLGEILGLHRLALEDVMHVSQRPKVEKHPGVLFIVARLLASNAGIESTQFSLFLGPNYVLTFQERPGQWFDPVRARIRAGGGRVRVGGSGYLAYALLDAVVDHYFPVLEEFGEQLDAIEQAVILAADKQSLTDIRAAKRDLLTLRRAAWPLRDLFGALLRESEPYFKDEDRVYLQDCHDHAVQVIDLIETYREVGSGLMDIYLSTISNRMNEIMKVLTMFASIFIPLSFIAGVYGMNFDTGRSPWNLPELEWYWGYPFALGIMLSVATGLVAYFWRKGWVGPSGR